MCEELTKLIYSRSNKGILIAEIDNKVKEAIFELAKLIIGNSCISFYENGVSIDLVGKCILEGYDIIYTSIMKNMTIITYEASIENMKMQILLDFDEKNKISNFND